MIFEEETEQVIGYIPKLLLMEAGEGQFSSVFQHGDGMVERLPVTTPAKDLVAAAEIDYRPYRKKIKRLREEHPMFAARLDIPVADVLAFEKDLFKFVDEKYPEIPKAIRDTKVLSPEMEELLTKAITQCKAER